VFHQFCQDKFSSDGLILSSSQFLLLSQLPQKMKLVSKVVKSDAKVIILLLWTKSMKHTVESREKRRKVLLGQ
jgi:hypothetical protein